MLLIADGSTDITQAAMSRVVQIVLAIVGGYFSLRVAQVDAKQSPAGDPATVAGRNPSGPSRSAQMDSVESELDKSRWQVVKHSSVLILVLFLIGAVLLGIKSVTTAMHAADLTAESGAAEVQLNKITIKATRRKDGCNIVCGLSRIHGSSIQSIM